MKPSEPVCLSLSVPCLFFLKNKFYTKCTYVCEPLPKTRALWFLGGWRGLMVYCAEQLKKKQKSRASLLRCPFVYDSTAFPCAASAWPCGENSWKQHLLITVDYYYLFFFFKFAIDWSISGYTGFSWCFFCVFFFSSWLLIWSFEFPDSVL